jgi:hypothetical protein
MLWRLLLPILLFGPVLHAQEVDYNCLTLEVDSEVFVEGKANVGGFRCFTSPLTSDKPIPSCFRKADGSIEISQVEFEIPIAGFHCGNPLILNDLKDVLDSDHHPNIAFEMHKLDARDVNGQFYQGEVLASTKVKGVSHDMTMPVEVDELEKNFYKISGQAPIYLSWYGIEQPSRLFGLLTLEDRVDVCFELYFKKH